MALTRESTTLDCPVPVSPVNIHTSSIIWTQQILFGNICVYTNTYMHAITIDEKRGHEFEGDQEGVYERVWREEGEGRNVVKNTFSKTNEQTRKK